MASAIPLSELEHFYYVIEAVKAGLGISVILWPLVMDDLQQGQLLAPFCFIGSGQSYVEVRRQTCSARAEHFCVWLVSEARATPVPGDTS
ncbi:hypothetical protein HU730_022480 [Pseudomonas sp. SWRI22]|uniref:hypothetical protein n=1 Tax=unclassified Pseudomonas TaxID=196821 RepID=UPI0016482B5A|nr:MULTISPECIES: hypothetical protein [unclassified Pseudomonas]MBV4512810.1 hypothetical protein [Pseudomonas sp. SWRI22]WEJ03820.1 hypothetical protein N2A98_16915 [Pseudomonas sp. FJ2-5-13]